MALRPTTGTNPRDDSGLPAPRRAGRMSSLLHRECGERPADDRKPEARAYEADCAVGSERRGWVASATKSCESPSPRGAKGVAERGCAAAERRSRQVAGRALRVAVDVSDARDRLSA